MGEVGKAERARCVFDSRLGALCRDVERWKWKVCDEWLFRQIDACNECKEEREFHKRNGTQKQKNAMEDTKALHESANTIKSRTKPV